MFFRGQDKKGHQEAPKELAGAMQRRVLECISFGAWISKTPAFQLLLFGCIDLSNRTPLMLLLFEFPEIFAEIFHKCSLFSVLPVTGKPLRLFGVAGPVPQSERHGNRITPRDADRLVDCAQLLFQLCTSPPAALWALTLEGCMLYTRTYMHDMET